MKLTLGSVRLNPALVGIAIAATAISGAIAVYGFSQLNPKSAKQPEAASTPVPPPTVSALGRLEPATEVVKIGVPLVLDGDRVERLQVREGEHVKTGQVIAILSSRDRLQSDLQQAQKQVKVAQAKLAQVKAGAKAGEIQAQSASIRRLQAQWQGERATQLASIRRLEAQIEGDEGVQTATIRKLEAELANATAEFNRYETLLQDGAISDSLFDSKRLGLETSRQQLQEAQMELKRIQGTGQQQLQEAKSNLARLEGTSRQELQSANATLDEISEIRPVDVDAAQAEVDAAIAAAQRAQTELDQVYIRAPMMGQILKVLTREGEKISTDGIVEIGATQTMMAIAEVYQSDIGKIRIGQPAKVTGQAFSDALNGSVAEIKQQVSRQNVFSNQPGENLDKRVVEVKIRLNLEDSRKVSNLTNLQVQTLIQVDTPTPAKPFSQPAESSRS
jgi:HlyD family secretion protein